LPPPSIEGGLIIKIKEFEMSEVIDLKIIARGPDLQKVTKTTFDVKLPDTAAELLENKEGISETKDVFALLCEVGKFYKSAMADDGKITISDGLKLVGVVKAAPAAVIGFNNVDDELTDKITDEEKAELKKVIIEAGVIEGDAEAAVLDGIDLAIMAKEYVQKYFIKRSL
jgi:hypothetical protein